MSGRADSSNLDFTSLDKNPIPKILTQARWIWPESHHWDLYNCYALFRYSFELDRVPAKAPLFITADQSYHLYLNGNYVCRGPARGFQKSWPFDEVDVSAYLQRGRNVLAVRAHNPGRSTFQYIHEGYAGLLVAAQWGKVAILSNSTWKCRRQQGVRRDTVPTSLELFPQESIDLRIEDPDWMQPDFDDQGWTIVNKNRGQNAGVYSVSWNAMPWFNLEPRGIPLLEERLVKPRSCIGSSKGRSAPDFLTVRNIAISRGDEGLAHKPCSLPATAMTFEPVKPGTWRSYLIDFGRVVVGSVIVDITHAHGGEVVETAHFETIDPDTLTPHFFPETHCRMAFAHRLICRRGVNRHQFHHPFGFRYMVLTVRNNPGNLTVSPSLRTTLYPLDIKGRFESSSSDLKKIWEACAWTQRCCSIDAYVDTPWREQAQWWGDARVQAWNTFHLNGDPRLFRRGIGQIASQTTPNGLTYGHTPTMAHHCILPDFTLIWIMTLWDDYWQTGSLEVFKKHQKTLCNALVYFREQTDPKTKLLARDHRYWLFLDWTDLFKDGFSSVYNLWLLIALEKVAEMYRLSRQTTEASQYLQWAKGLRFALRNLIGRDGFLRDGITFKGKVVSETSVHAQTMAIMAGLHPKSAQTMIQNRLLPSVLGTLRSDVKPSAYWITYIYSVLIEHGYGREVLGDIQKRWRSMADFGSTFERFDSEPGVHSHSHAWSAHPLFHLMQILGGVTQCAPAWEKINYSPAFVGKHAKIAIPTPHGLILSSWKRSGNTVHAQLDLPKNITANIRLFKMKSTVTGGFHKFIIKPDP